VEGCIDNAHCTSVDPRKPICQEPGGACVELTRPDGECYVGTRPEPSLTATATAQDMIVVGAFGPTLRATSWLALELAAGELNGPGGLSEAVGAIPLVIVQCRDSTDTLSDAMDHLVHDLRASAILASLEDESLRIILERPSTQDRAVFLSPFGANPWSAVAGAPTPPAWYLGPTYDSVVAAYPAALQRIAESLEAQGVDRQRLRIASVVSDAREDADLAHAVEGVIELDGKDRDALEREGRYQSSLLVGNSPSGLQALASYGPDIVLLFIAGSSRGSPYLPRSLSLEPLEANAREQGRLGPIYVAGPRSVDDPFLVSHASSDASFRARSIGVRAERELDATSFAAFSTRFRQAYPLSATTDAELRVAAHAYDGVYFLAYAAAAARRANSSSNAPALAAGLMRVTDPAAERVDVGPAGLERAAQLLATAQPMNLVSSTGTADFDPETRARSGPVQLYCWTVAGEPIRLADYDASADDWVVVGAGCGEEAIDAGG